MRVLVADDEPIMLESIARILKNEPDILLETARSGREAIEKAMSFRPELVMIDIKMPGINGLEALSEIRRIDPQVIAIILSAYDNFTYAQEAIRCGVKDYLIKPVNKTRILEVIHHARQQLEERRSSRQEELKIRERYKKCLPLIENEFVHTVINGHLDEYTLQEFEELLGISLKAGFFTAISFFPEFLPFESKIEPKYSFFEKTARLVDEIRQLFPCVVGIRPNPVIFFIPLASASPADLQQAAYISIQRLQERIEQEHLGVNYRIGVGSMALSFTEYRYSYSDAMQALHIDSPATVCHCHHVPPSTLPWETRFDAKMAELLEALRFGHIHRVNRLSDELMSEIILHYPEDHDRLFAHLLELILSSYRIAKTIIKSPLPSPGFHQLSALFHPNGSIQEITATITAQLLDLARRIHEEIETHTQSIIYRAKQVIEARYATELSLEELARSVSVSPYYLCRLFREALGCSFIEYLTKYRLEKALHLLAQGLSIKECAFAVGYNDPNYFSRIFRKYYQFTPTEYRDRHLSSKEATSDETR